MKTNKISFFLLFLLIVFSASRKTESIELYVSVEASENATGSLSQPFSTIPEAVTALREMRETGNNSPATIYLREGRHLLTETLVLGLGDGRIFSQEQESLLEPGAGESELPAQLTVAAYPDEHPIISAGMPVTKVPSDFELT